MSQTGIPSTFSELKARAPRFAVLPIGSFEQHGPHLPMDTDSRIAGLIAKGICQARNGLLLPVLPFSCSHEHAGFFGSTSIGSAALAAVIRDIADSLRQSGIHALVIVNGHGGNYVLGNIAQEMNARAPRLLLLPSRQHWQAAMAEAGIEKTPHEDMHAGELETSIMLATYPGLVRRDRIEDHEAPERPWLHVSGMQAYTYSGVIGYPSLATAEKGERFLEAAIRMASQDIHRFISLVEKENRSDPELDDGR